MNARAAQQLVDTYGPWSLGLIPLCSPQTAHPHGGMLCSSPGKVPVVREWQKLASLRRDEHLTPDSVSQEMARYLALGGNVGLAIPAGMLVLDADDERSVGRLAIALHDAPLQRTARGAHLVVRLPDGLEHSNTVKVELEPGLVVDLRGAGAQIVVSPSVHASGASYVWERSLPSSLDELPELSRRWAETLQRPKRMQDSVPRAMPGEAIRAGVRNDTLFRLARSLKYDGLLEESVLAALRVENERRCAPPLESAELEHLVASSFRLPDRKDFLRRGE